ncbi:Cell division cycle protein [Paragonimus heterotremus]|uniref:Cell division cycle protein n=1 Tax=Paragonimus heterotremus TaxID=100268 RepID=A0A8J4WF44_9TREM|nr:Cell division cycle protein [Paragonimus heterotremus]
MQGSNIGGPYNNPSAIVQVITDSGYYNDSDQPVDVNLCDAMRLFEQALDNDNWSQCDEEDENGPRVCFFLGELYILFQRPEFPEFEAALSCAIRKLGGVVFPKLNWSAPKVCFPFRYLIHPQDASWMLCGNSLKCSSFSDIYLLLKASDFVAHDLTAPFALCADVPVEQLKEKQDFQPILVLRRWSDYRPDGEFRCFVRERKLVAISQRMHDSYFQSVAQNVEHIKQELYTFFNKRIRDRFPLNDYTVDLYYELSNSPNRRSKIVLIDFNVFGPPTEPLLFNWSELEDNNLIERVSDPMIRVQTDRSIRPNVFSQYSVPIDLIDIASGSDPSKLMEFVQTCVKEQQKN